MGLLIVIPVSSRRSQPARQRHRRGQHGQTFLVSWSPQVLRPSGTASIRSQVRSWMPRGLLCRQKQRPLLPADDGCAVPSECGCAGMWNSVNNEEECDRSLCTHHQEIITVSSVLSLLISQLTSFMKISKMQPMVLCRLNSHK